MVTELYWPTSPVRSTVVSVAAVQAELEQWAALRSPLLTMFLAFEHRTGLVAGQLGAFDDFADDAGSRGAPGFEGGYELPSLRRGDADQQAAGSLGIIKKL